MARRSYLLVVVAAAGVLFATAVSAQAAAVQIGSTSDIYDVSVTGGSVYWTNPETVNRVDIATGAASVIYRAPRYFSVTDVEADGGTVVLSSQGFRGRYIVTNNYIYSPATNALRRVATGRLRITGAFDLCGSRVMWGRVKPNGDALMIKNSASTSRKRCKKPISVRTIISTVSPNSGQTLLDTDLARGGSLQRIGLPQDADLAGSRLLLTGNGVGVYDLTNKGFTVVAAGPRYGDQLAQVDPAGDVLVTDYFDRPYKTVTRLFDALSGYSAPIVLEPKSPRINYFVCGDYLARANFDEKRGQISGVTVLPNPLIPQGLVGSTPQPELQQSLWSVGCDATTLAWVTSPYNDRGESLFVAPLAGP
ncbi:MAG: hypothetical protein ACRDKI_01620 [Solirubrobacterales bacterium]